MSTMTEERELLTLPTQAELASRPASSAADARTADQLASVYCAMVLGSEAL